MNRLLYVFLGLLLLNSLFVGCTEDDLVPNPVEKNYFLEPEGASEADLRLQKEFYNQEKVYLLFNDTLSSVYLGDDSRGRPVYEYQTVDFSYSLITSSGAFKFQYLMTDVEKRAAAEFISDKILPSLGESMRPYSFLLVDEIECYEDFYGELVLTANTIVYSGWKCTAIAVRGVDEMSDEEQNTYRLTLLKSMVNKKMAALDEGAFDDFYAFGAPYYGTYCMNEEAEEFIAQYPTQEDLGFLSTYGYGYNGYLWIVNFKAKGYDLEDYTNALFETSEDEFMARYADYPVVQKKYRILKKIVEDLGVIF